jgi:hypothetical protein
MNEVMLKITLIYKCGCVLYRHILKLYNKKLIFNIVMGLPMTIKKYIIIVAC